MENYEPRHRRDVPRVAVYDHTNRLVMMPVNCWDKPIIDPADARHRAEV